MTAEEIHTKDISGKQTKNSSIHSKKKHTNGNFINLLFRKGVFIIISVSTFMIILNTSTRYECELKLTKIDKLNKILEEERYRARITETIVISESRPQQIEQLLHKHQLNLKPIDNHLYSIKQTNE